MNAHLPPHRPGPAPAARGAAPQRQAAASRARRWLCAALALNALYGAVQGWATGGGAAAPGAVDFAYALFLLPLPYLWLRADAAAHGWQRGLVLSGAAIYLPWLAIPWYLLRSRRPGHRAAAVARALGFGVLAMPLTYLLGGAPLALWRGGW